MLHVKRMPTAGRTLAEAEFASRAARTVTSAVSVRIVRQVIASIGNAARVVSGTRFSAELGLDCNSLRPSKACPSCPAELYCKYVDGYSVTQYCILRPCGRAADPGAIRRQRRLAKMG